MLLCLLINTWRNKSIKKNKDVALNGSEETTCLESIIQNVTNLKPL